MKIQNTIIYNPEHSYLGLIDHRFEEVKAAQLDP